MRDFRQAYQPVFEILTQPGLGAGFTRIAERIGLNLNALEDALGIPRKPPAPEMSIEVRLQRAWSTSIRGSLPRRTRSWPV